MRKYVFYSLLILLESSIFMAQDQKKTAIANEFSFLVGPVVSNITNNNIKNDQYADSYGAINLNLGVKYTFNLNKNLGVNIGLEYTKYENATVYKGGYRSSTTTVDRDNYIYYPTVVTDYTNTITINSLDIPLNLRVNAPINENCDWFVDLGIMVNAAITNNINQNGIYNKQGSYPHQTYDNVFFLIENDPYYGYTNTVYPNTTKQVDSKGIGFSGFLSSGFKLKASKNTFFTISASYMVGQSDVGPMETSDYQNIFGNISPYAEYNLMRTGISIGFGLKVY